MKPTSDLFKRLIGLKITLGEIHIGGAQGLNRLQGVSILLLLFSLGARV